MRTAWLARRLGLDGNPLRRRTDRAAAWAAALLLAVFLIGAPLLSVAAIGWAGRAGAADQPAERSWRQVPAVLLEAPQAPAREMVGYSRVRARWTAPADEVPDGTCQRPPVTNTGEPTGEGDDCVSPWSHDAVSCGGGT